MPLAAGSIPSLADIGMPAVRPGLQTADLPQIDITIAALPELPGPASRFVRAVSTASGSVAMPAAAGSPATLPAVDWAFVAAMPEPPPQRLLASAAPAPQASPASPQEGQP